MIPPVSRNSPLYALIIVMAAGIGGGSIIAVTIITIIRMFHFV